MAARTHRPTVKSAKKASRKTARRAAARHRPKARGATGAKRKNAPSGRWSRRVTEHSDALDLRHRVFTLHDPKKIAASLKLSAEHSKRRKSNSYRSAMSMLTFYINRAGKTLPTTQRRRLERAKDELKRQFHRDA